MQNIKHNKLKLGCIKKVVMFKPLTHLLVQPSTRVLQYAIVVIMTPSVSVLFSPSVFLVAQLKKNAPLEVLLLTMKWLFSYDIVLSKMN